MSPLISASRRRSSVISVIRSEIVEDAERGGFSLLHQLEATLRPGPGGNSDCDAPGPMRAASRFRNGKASMHRPIRTTILIVDIQDISNHDDASPLRRPPRRPDHHMDHQSTRSAIPGILFGLGSLEVSRCLFAVYIIHDRAMLIARKDSHSLVRAFLHQILFRKETPAPSPAGPLLSEIGCCLPRSHGAGSMTRLCSACHDPWRLEMVARPYYFYACGISLEHLSLGSSSSPFQLASFGWTHV